MTIQSHLSNGSGDGFEQLTTLAKNIRQLLKPLSRVKLHGEIEQCIPPVLGETRVTERDLAIECLKRLTDQLLTDLDVLGMFYEEQCTFGGLEEGRCVFTNVPRGRGAPITYVSNVLVALVTPAEGTLTSDTSERC